MKSFYLFSLVAILSIVALFSVQASTTEQAVQSEQAAQLLAFPGAEGFGKYAVGGRAGSVYHVTNLNDSGSGSFRDAVSQPNRVVVFDVAGVIRLQSRVVVKNNLYIAGQTAPGEGITLYGNGLSFSGANQTICRYLRVRCGKVGSDGSDALGIANGSNMIFDHVSVAWGRDENFSISGDGPENITIQHCLIAQGLQGHSAGGLVQTDKVSIYRSLYIHNDTRNPKFKGSHQYVNNIVYNWKTAAYIMGGDSEGTSYANAQGNLFITGPMGSKNAFSGANERYHIFAQDNRLDDTPDGLLNTRSIDQSEYGGGPTFEAVPYDYPILPTLSADSLYDALVSGVGACLPYRDPLDWLMIRDLTSLGTKGSIISDEAELEIGAPDTWQLWAGDVSSEQRKDSDGDGMPDEWEEANGTDKTQNDAMVIREGYANIEHYINSITNQQSQYFLKSPMSLKVGERGATELDLEWLDFTAFEQGYIIEQKIDGVFQEVARTDTNVCCYRIKGLTAESSYEFRVKAYNDRNESGYSNVLSVKTKSIPIDVIMPTDFRPNHTWNGTTSNVWDHASDNWTEGLFVDGENVLFNETSNGGTIQLSADVKAGHVMVNSDSDYVFSGVLAGDSSLNKAGAGTLTLGNDNTYKGGTVIWDGVLKIGKLANGGLSSSIGTSQNWVWNGGKVLYTGGSVSTNREVSLINSTSFDVNNASSVVTFTGAVSGEGDLLKEGAGTLKSAYNLHTYTGNTWVKGGTYQLEGKDLDGNAPMLYGKLILEGGSFVLSGGDGNQEGNVKFDVEVRGDQVNRFHIASRNNIYSKFSGSGTIQLDVEYVREFYKGDWSGFYGTVIANQKGSSGNQFHLDNAGYGGLPNARLVMQGNLEMRGTNAKTFYIGGLSGSSTTTLACCQVKKDGGIITWIVGGLGTDETFNGKITNGIEHTSRIGNTSLVKEGEGLWRINGACRYRGSTIINGGTFIMNGAHVKDKDHTGTYFTPAAYTVNEGGTLSGKGSTVAPVVVKSGGILAPGDLSIGTFTINNNVNLASESKLLIEVNATKGTADKLTTTGSMMLAGILEIQLVEGEYKQGSSFTILSAASYAGKFSRISPEIPAEGLIWNTDQLYSLGRLKVEAKPSALDALSLSQCVLSQEGGIVLHGIDVPLQIFDVCGKLVYTRSSSANNVSTDSGDLYVPLSRGMYLVKAGNVTVHVMSR